MKVLPASNILVERLIFLPDLVIVLLWLRIILTATQLGDTKNF